MKRAAVALLATALIAGAVALSRQSPEQLPNPRVTELRVASEDRNPWTNLRLNNDPQEFQFAVVSDRTGGHRAKIFSRAVEQLNLLQPEFVLSVGDLIEGYSTDKDKLLTEWKEFQNFVARLQMPFFYVPGNHDVSNPFMEKLWQEKFGRRYYHFVYKDVLFLMLCADDPAGSSSISAEQAEYVRKALAENPSVRWTIVSLHKPIWTARDLEKNGWLAVEKALAGRNYTVFAGHVHRYQKFQRNGMNYYQLATTGGGSRLRGVPYGEFDHIVWVTMKQSGPVLANIMLDGILPEDLRVPPSDEEGVKSDRKPTHPVKGFVYLDGTPAAGATVVLHQKAANKKGFVRVADGRVEGDGSFMLSTYGAFDGAPAGDYVVTVVPAGRSADEEGPPKKITLPERYAKPDTTDLTATVKAGKNEFTFDLRK